MTIKTRSPVFIISVFVLSMFQGTANSQTLHRPEAKQNPQIDCIANAAMHHGVNIDIVRALIWGESKMRADAYSRNENGSYDLGAAQTNSIHFDELARLGVPTEKLTNGCVSSYVAAWMYARHVKRLGNTWRAVGAYHSMTTDLNEAYANSVAIILGQWGKLQKGWLPFPNAALSSSEALKRRKNSGSNQTQSQSARLSSGMVALTENSN